MLHLMLKIGLHKMKKYMKKNNITDLSKCPDGPKALEQALFFVPEAQRAALVNGIGFMLSVF